MSTVVENFQSFVEPSLSKHDTGNVRVDSSVNTCCVHDEQKLFVESSFVENIQLFVEPSLSKHGTRNVRLDSSVNTRCVHVVF